jgi:kinesin family member 1
MVGGKADRPFTFDYCLWSFDGFYTFQDTGYHAPSPGGRYADQKYLWQTLGAPMLDKALGGLNVCMLAYGPMSAGKSYTMFGEGADRGVVPMMAEAIFKRMTFNVEPGTNFKVQFHMVEIYMEKVRDLLMPKISSAQGLAIREKNKTTFVDGVCKKVIHSVDEFDHWLSIGNKQRTVNEIQSKTPNNRSHTVVTFELVKERSGREQCTTITLVDLAGPEKQGWYQMGENRTAETNAINLSLSALGNVIMALAKNSENKGPKVIVPYRESSLTRILTQALGGNSSTVMLCAIKPGSSSYDETMSTLKFAERAALIKNDPAIFEQAQDRMLRELLEENQKLKSDLKGGAKKDFDAGDHFNITPAN